MEFMDQSLGQLARRIPGATRVFDAHAFDFCCAANCTLRTVAAASGVDASGCVCWKPARPTQVGRTGAPPATPRWWTTSSRATTLCTASSCPS